MSSTRVISTLLASSQNADTGEKTQNKPDDKLS